MAILDQPENLFEVMYQVRQMRDKLRASYASNQEWVLFEATTQARLKRITTRQFQPGYEPSTPLPSTK